MGNTREKLLKSLVLKIVSLRPAKFSFLCSIKMQMEIYWQGFFHPGVKLETAGSQRQLGLVWETCWRQFSLWVSCSDQQLEIALKFSLKIPMIPISLWGCFWLPHSSAEWKISWLLASLNAAPNDFVAQRPMGLDSRPERRPGEYWRSNCYHVLPYFSFSMPVKAVLPHRHKLLLLWPSPCKEFPNPVPIGIGVASLA